MSEGDWDGEVTTEDEGDPKRLEDGRGSFPSPSASAATPAGVSPAEGLVAVAAMVLIAGEGRLGSERNSAWNISSCSDRSSSMSWANGSWLGSYWSLISSSLS